VVKKEKPIKPNGGLGNQLQVFLLIWKKGNSGVDRLRGGEGKRGALHGQGGICGWATSIAILPGNLVEEDD